MDERIDRDQLTQPAPRATWTWPDRSRPWSLLSLFAAVVAAYGIGSFSALFLVEASGLQGVLFIPAGVTVAFLLRLPRRLWWIVLMGAGITEAVMDVNGGFSISESMGFAVANVAEPLVGASIVTAACGPPDLARRRHLIWFAFGAVLIGPLVGAALGAAADRLFGGDAFLTTFGQWWLGDALGVVLVGSVILAWGSSPDRRSLFSVWGVGLVTGSMALTTAIFSFTDLPLAFSVLIGVVVAGVVFGVRAVSVTALSVALTIAIVLTVDSGPLIVGMAASTALVLIKLQVGLFTLAGLLIAAESHERERAVKRAARSALEAESLERERMKEQNLARRVQRGLLPDRLLTRPGVDIAARYEAAGDALEVGGDWYDTIQLDESRIGVAVGDIVGHGIEAMISMGRLRTAMAALALHNEDPATLLSQLDEFVGGPDGTKYATVFYAMIDFDRKRIRYASAGHPPGLLLAPDGRVKWLDQGQGEPLTGVSTDHRQASVGFEPGSTLILYSDGLIEQRGESLSTGLARLERHVPRIAHHTADAICDELFDGLGARANKDDDAVVLVMKVRIDDLEYNEVFPALPEELRNMRNSIRSWASARGIPMSTVADLLIAVGEATANTVRHAYRESPGGDVRVRIELVDEVLVVGVTDTGAWREPGPNADTPGLGIEIMRALTDELQMDHTGEGTEVIFRMPVFPKGPV